MCGRFAVNRQQVEQWLTTHLVNDFHCADNQDLRPSQTVSSLIKTDNSFKQLDLLWGIKPKWAKKLLINAQVETVHEKPTFKQAFINKRCVVPFTAWYEWKTHQENKIKYRFSPTKADVNEPLFMAGIYYQSVSEPQPPLLVTLTCEPTTQCAEFHQRMPLLITKEQLDLYLTAPIQILIQSLATVNKKYSIVQANT